MAAQLCFGIFGHLRTFGRIVQPIGELFDKARSHFFGELFMRLFGNGLAKRLRCVRVTHFTGKPFIAAA